MRPAGSLSDCGTAGGEKTLSVAQQLHTIPAANRPSQDYATKYTTGSKQNKFIDPSLK